MCEPCGNLVKRYRLEERPDGSLRAHNRTEDSEFLTSADERFRPVNLFDGPDGALYVVDMYRGVIQHKIFVTSFLRAQIIERELEQPTGLGRIWRVVHDEYEGAPGPDFDGASWTEVAAALAHENGWWRDRAQRVLIEEGADDSDAIELAEAAAAGPSPLGRMHALWALEGMGRMTPELAAAAIADPDKYVVLTGMRCAEPWLNGRTQDLIDAVVEAAEGAGVHVARQALLSLGEGASEASDVGILRVLDPVMDDGALRAAALSGLMGRELDLVKRLVSLSMFLQEQPGRASFLRDLARCVASEGRTDRIEYLLYVIVRRPPTQHWQATAMLEGVLAARPKGPDGKPTYLQIAEEPVSYGDLTRIDSEQAGPLGREVAANLAWPGKSGVKLPEVRPLNANESAHFDRGRALYLATCAQCHQESGRGELGKAPPLRFSEYVLGDPERLTRIVRWGLVGPVEIDGERWDAEMPAWPSTDGDLSALLTYLRREWGHGADPVTLATVRKVSEEVGERSDPYTLEELAGDG